MRNITTSENQSPMTARSRAAFTLIELLIVVAIIAILAAIAVPNFLEAQTRAKTARTKADMRAVATAIETYRLDTNTFPPPYGVYIDWNKRDSFSVLSTPTAYLDAAKIIDPFAVKNSNISKMALTYEAMNQNSQIIETSGTPGASVGSWVLPTSADGTAKWWWIASRGPDKTYDGFKGNTTVATMEDACYNANSEPRYLVGITYDASNGTVSAGNIYRSGGDVRGCSAADLMAAN